jgi:hypothetical protein
MIRAKTVDSAGNSTGSGIRGKAGSGRSFRQTASKTRISRVSPVGNVFWLDVFMDANVEGLGGLIVPAAHALVLGLTGLASIVAFWVSVSHR